MRKLSVKRAKQNREYLKMRKVFLEENCFCAVHNRWFKVHNYVYEGSICMATEIHHKKGRTGALLTDTKYFLPVCSRAHKQIEENPEWAKENGYSLSRLSV